MTYRDLDIQGRAIAVNIAAEVSAGERIALLFPPGLDFITGLFGCLYGGFVAVPAYVPHSEADAERLSRVLKDAQVAVVLTNDAGRGLIQRWLPAWTSGVRSTSDMHSDAAGLWRERKIRGSDLAYLQYTSGSTTEPRGVMIRHENVLANLRYIASDGAFTSDSVSVSWLPPYHDMGLVYGLLEPLFVGMQAVLFSPAAFVRRPLRWLEAISAYKGTHSGAPNFAYDLCVQKMQGASLRGLDLTCWRVAFNGSEPVRRETLDRFCEAFRSWGFRRSALYPVYGLAEATLKVTSPTAGEELTMCATGGDGGDAPALPPRMIVGCGRAGGGHRVMIVDPDCRRVLEEGSIGEIWVSGPSVACGYWNLPDETGRVFYSELADGTEGTFLRTGDLGFLRDGILFIAGRVKDCIIIRGQNFYPQDIEATVEACHPAVRPAGTACFSVEDSGGERLVVVAEIRRSSSGKASEIGRAIRRAVANGHGLRPWSVVLVAAGGLPRTTSGKIRRGECRRLFSTRGLSTIYILTTNDTDPLNDAPLITRESLLGEDRVSRLSMLTAYIRNELRRVSREADLDDAADLDELALDSLAAVEICHLTEVDLGISITPAALFECSNIGALARRLLDILESDSPSVPAIAQTSHGPDLLPLSAGQRGLWLQQQKATASSALTISRAVRIHDAVDPDRLSAALRHVAELHPLLRARIVVRNGEPMHTFNNDLTAPLLFIDASMWDAAALRERLEHDAGIPIALDAGILFRAHLYHLGGNGHILLLSVHHCICDFWSLGVLLRDLAEEYEHPGAGRVAAPGLQYWDFVNWQTEYLAGPEGERLAAYWRTRLSGDLPVLNLGRPRGERAAPSRAGILHFTIPSEVALQIRQLSRTNRTTVQTTLLTIFNVLLYRYTGQTDFLVGVPEQGRHRAGLEEIFGYFVNPLVVRSDLSGNPEFEALLAQVCRTVLEGIEHASLPFPLLVGQLAQKEASGSPVFQVMFVFQRARLRDQQNLAPLALQLPNSFLDVGPWRLWTEPVRPAMTQFDLTLSMAEVGTELAGVLEYDASLFNPREISGMASHFCALAESAAVNPSVRVGSLKLLTTADRKELATWNTTAQDYGAFEPLHLMMERRYANHPESIAAQFADKQLSYGELNARSTAVALELRRLGLGADMVAGICAERSLELLIALLAIWKAGAAYLPLDPSSPPERLQYIVDRGKPSLLVCDEPFTSRFSAAGISALSIRQLMQAGRLEAPVFSTDVAPDNLAYVIFTSGSTGQPKGVMNTHVAIRNRLIWMQEQYRATVGDVVLQKTSSGFDVSVWEFFWPLLAGSRIVLARPGGQRDNDYLIETIEQYGITIIHFVPSALSSFLEQLDEHPCASVRTVICSGEALTSDLRNRFFQRLSCGLHNLYGPTEAAVDVSAWDCNQPCDPVPIGRPIANIQLHVMSPNLELMPVSRAGELCIGGVGPARGYRGDPAATALAFVPDPEAKDPGSRMYRTGDLARLSFSGAIEYLGRIDSQVKIRGCRVELGEVESVLRSHPDIGECAVIAEEAGASGMRIVSYVALRPGSTVLLQDLRAFLRTRLPEYMIPALFVTLDRLPLSANGKLDRRSLPDVSTMLRTASAAFVAPRTDIERAVAEIWAKLLDVPQVGADDNFFELGGHSILATSMLSRVRDMFDVEIPIAAVFSEEVTVAALATRIEEILAELRSVTTSQSN
jgi:amino acid adenylation domain-containing protein